MSLDISQLTSSTTLTLGTVIVSLLAVVFVRWFITALNTRGPWGLPIVGYYPLLKPKFYVQLHDMAKKYGPAYMINLAGQNFLYVDNWAALKEINVNKSDCFPSRGQKPSIFHDTFGDGLAFLEGEHWRVQRRFFVQAMREIGLTKDKAEVKGPVSEIVRSTLEFLDTSASKNEPVDIFTVMMKRCTDVVLRLVLGNDVGEKREKIMNDVYLKLIVPMTEKYIVLTGNTAWYLYMALDPQYRGMIECRNILTENLAQIVNEHRASLDPEQPPRDFIDMYLLAKASKEKKGDPQAKFFTDDDLYGSLLQAYGDGSVSVGIFAAVLLREFCKYSDAQEAVYKEIIEVIGTERVPEWEDRQKLPLLMSTMKEFLRLLSFINIFPGMECTKDTTVMGVRVPKGCVVLQNFWAINRDPTVYENPDQMDMTRFLPEKPKIESLSFGIGKRACAGEALVMMQCFVFVSAILQNFKLVSAPDNVDDEDDIEKMMKFQLKAEPRPSSKFAKHI